ncbi:endonuclease/exonuclease/phosphatase family protein [Bacteroides sp.]|uniref:endonuclease/exonuclease/phosphatase family protein n=1 Tax=Bacteroides sp. TaxID=29523 RepID=UPI002FCBDEE9
MKHISKVFTYLLLAINAFFVGILLLTAYSPYIHPVVHPIESCMGLTFPIFLLINLCFFIFWLIVHYKYSALSLLGFLLCYSQILTYLPMNFRTAPTENSLKLLSYNIMAFNHLEKTGGANPILSYIQKLDADIVCLQEYVTPQNTKGHLNEKEIRKGLKAYRYRNVQQIGEKGSNQLACYSKYPILSARVIPYESHYNGSVAYEIKVGDDTLTVINNHLESNKLTKEDKVVYESMIKDPDADKVKSGARLLINKLAEASAIRSKQVDAIAREIATSPHAPIIVCGDFNDSPISYTHRVIAEQLKDAFTESGRGLGISYNQNKFYFRIDHILISKNMSSHNCTVDRSIDSSDHYPIWCHIEIN